LVFEAIEARVDHGELHTHPRLECFELEVDSASRAPSSRLQRLVGDEVVPPAGRPIHEDRSSTHAIVLLELRPQRGDFVDSHRRSPIIVIIGEDDDADDAAPWVKGNALVQTGHAAWRT